MDVEKFSNFKYIRDTPSKKAQRMLKKNIKDTYVKTIELARGLAEVSSIFMNEDSCLNDLGLIRKIAKAYRDYNEVEFRQTKKTFINNRPIHNVNNKSKNDIIANQNGNRSKISICSTPEVKKALYKNKIESKRLLAITPGPGVGDKLKKIKEDFIVNNFQGKNYSFLKKYDSETYRSLSNRENKKSEIDLKFDAVNDRLINCEQKLKDFENKINSYETNKNAITNFPLTPDIFKKRQRLDSFIPDTGRKPRTNQSRNTKN